MQRDYGMVLQRVREGQRQYKDPVYLGRFRIMEAIALAGSGEFERADTLLTEFISTRPKDSLKDWAERVISFVKKNKPAPVVVTDSMAKASTVSKSASVSASIPADSAAAGQAKQLPEPIPAEYTYKPQEEHYVLFYFTKMESRVMGVKAGIGDINALKYTAQKLNTTLSMLQPDLGLLLVKPFVNVNAARSYMNALKINPQLLKEYKPGEYQFLMISARNYRKLEADRKMQPYLQFYNAHYK